MFINLLKSKIEVFPYTQQPVSIKLYKNSTNNLITFTQYNALTDEKQKSEYTEIEKTIDPQDRDGRVLSEENVALLISRITNHSSYVLSDTLNDYSGSVEVSRSLEFILDGRYFKVTETKDNYNIFDYSTDDNAGKSLWVKSVLDVSAESPKGYAVLAGIDSTNVNFKGLEFQYSVTKPTSTENWFQLLDPDAKIPTASKFRLTGASIQNIDGGTV